MVAVGGGDGHQKNLSDSREIKKTVPIDDLTIACLEIFKKNDANIQ